MNFCKLIFLTLYFFFSFSETECFLFQRNSTPEQSGGFFFFVPLGILKYPKRLFQYLVVNQDLRLVLLFPETSKDGEMSTSFSYSGVHSAPSF